MNTNFCKGNAYHPIYKILIMWLDGFCCWHCPTHLTFIIKARHKPMKLFNYNNKIPFISHPGESYYCKFTVIRENFISPNIHKFDPLRTFADIEIAFRKCHASQIFISVNKSMIIKSQNKEHTNIK